MLTPVLEALVLLAHATVIGVVLLARRRDPTATVAWILFILLFPFVGVLLYLTLGHTRVHRIARRPSRAEARVQELISRQEVHYRFEQVSGSEDERTRAMLRLGSTLASMPASRGNAARVLNDAAATYHEMTLAINAACHHIHVEFYIIIQPTRTTRSCYTRV